ncbi:MAG: thioredoxin domain-containing protein [Actinomycetaceae bacterium]|nr:thioredoxin domain-containing protein [Actinomycetaceae bacterium]
MAAKRPTKDETRLKAEAMRQAQKRREERTRNIIIGVVSALLVLTIAAVAWVIMTREPEPAADPKPTAVASANADASESPENGESTETAQPGESAEARSFVLSADGVGQEKPGVPTLEEYYDYSCHACADVSALLGQGLEAEVENGTINMKLIPVNVVDMAFHPIATDAVSKVYNNQPDKFVEFHQALLTFFKGEFDNAKGDVVQDTDASVEQVKKIAEDVGISEDVIATFDPAGANTLLEANTNAWKARQVEGREGLGTPEFVSNNKKIKLSGQSVEEYVKNLVEGVKSAQ